MMRLWDVLRPAWDDAIKKESRRLMDVGEHPKGGDGGLIGIAVQSIVERETEENDGE